MNSPIIQLLVLAAIAVFLILRLRGVLGTREGFEKPPVAQPVADKRRKPDFEVIEGGPDNDIADHVPENSPAADALAEMKRADPQFHVGEFLGGAKGAYEMILMAFEKGDLSSVTPFISEDVFEAFQSVIDQREEQKLTIDANFIGVSNMAVNDATFDKTTKEAEITIRFASEMTYVVRDAGGDIVDGSDSEVKRQKDVWTFARVMGTDDPNWRLVATDA
ncbi:Tim44/TimA family putative adaptor protein [Yoonia sp. 208BN28-4]|uniref:Tim44/TimA family putative adaptor protein n=1 Tax=Yoonia sp. 208BN28-4 TaxID=3126505 RepID=UPI0030B5BB5C